MFLEFMYAYAVASRHICELSCLLGLQVSMYKHATNPKHLDLDQLIQTDIMDNVTEQRKFEVICICVPTDIS